MENSFYSKKENIVFQIVRSSPEPNAMLYAEWMIATATTFARLTGVEVQHVRYYILDEGKAMYRPRLVFFAPNATIIPKESVTISESLTMRTFTLTLQ